MDCFTALATREPEDNDCSVILPQREISDKTIDSEGLAAVAEEMQLTQCILARNLNLAMRSSAAAPCERVYDTTKKYGRVRIDYARILHLNNRSSFCYSLRMILSEISFIDCFVFLIFLTPALIIQAGLGFTVFWVIKAAPYIGKYA